MHYLFFTAVLVSVLVMFEHAFATEPYTTVYEQYHLFGSLIPGDDSHFPSGTRLQNLDCGKFYPIEYLYLPPADHGTTTDACHQLITSGMLPTNHSMNLAMACDNGAKIPDVNFQNPSAIFRGTAKIDMGIKGTKQYQPGSLTFNNTVTKFVQVVDVKLGLEVDEAAGKTNITYRTLSCT